MEHCFLKVIFIKEKEVEMVLIQDVKNVRFNPLKIAEKNMEDKIKHPMSGNQCSLGRKLNIISNYKNKNYGRVNCKK